jgi:hypothetical protein
MDPYRPRVAGVNKSKVTMMQVATEDQLPKRRATAKAKSNCQSEEQLPKRRATAKAKSNCQSEEQLPKATASEGGHYKRHKSGRALPTHHTCTELREQRR